MNCVNEEARASAKKTDGFSISSVLLFQLSSLRAFAETSREPERKLNLGVWRMPLRVTGGVTQQNRYPDQASLWRAGSQEIHLRIPDFGGNDG
jgi:alpha-glucuronidase